MKTFLASFILGVSIVNGDGLPLTEDGNGIDAKHVFVETDGSQKEEMIALGSLTLSDSQWAKARKKSPDCPKRIETVYPKDWSDCTCGSEEEAYAIRFEGNRVAVVFSHLSGDPARFYRLRLADSGGTDLSVDERGQFYHHGVLIPFNLLLESSEVLAKPNPRAIPETTTVSIDIPMGMTENSTSLKDRLFKLRAKLEKFGWDVFVY